MARRYEIIKKTSEGVFRVRVQEREHMEHMVELAQADPETRYIVVKDRYLNRRGLVWRRNTQEQIDYWILDRETPHIEFRPSPKKLDKE